MNTSAIALAALLFAAAPAPNSASVGDPLPETDFDEILQSGAESLEDFTGRVLLVEFFEHW